jgi:hypothetical protein
MPKQERGTLWALVWRCNDNLVLYLDSGNEPPNLELDANLFGGGDWEDANVYHEDEPPMPPQGCGLWRMELKWRTLTDEEREEMGSELSCLYDGPPIWMRVYKHATRKKP